MRWCWSGVRFSDVDVVVVVVVAGAREEEDVLFAPVPVDDVVVVETLDVVDVVED